MIRCATISDLPALLELDRHISAAELKNAISQGRVLVIFSGDALVGWLRFGYFWDNIPFMNMLYILDGHRGQGLGSSLVAFWEREMQKQGHSRVLTSTQSNERAQFFYRKLGYTECGALLLPNEPLEMIFLKEISE